MYELKEQKTFFLKKKKHSAAEIACFLTDVPVRPSVWLAARKKDGSCVCVDFHENENWRILSFSAGKIKF